jgi:peptidoglycan/LPS O-acetylase OafA/YrhL
LSKKEDSKRLACLDGLRCVAVIGAMLFHYFVRWTPPKNGESLYPYGSAFANAVLWYGQYGVELFFVISGFVIAMTLTRCRSVAEFAARRYSRLAPAMLLCSLVTWLVLSLAPQAPFPTSASWFLSSLTFLDPEDLNRWFATDRWQSIEGVYWTLYIEVKFYVLVAFAYFASRRLFPWTMCGIAIAGLFLKALHVRQIGVLTDTLLIPGFLPWFLIGIGFHERHQQRSPARSLGPIGIGWLLLLVWSRQTGNPPLEVALGIPVFFAVAMEWQPLRRLLSTRVLTAVGVASYSLYLIHQYVGVTFIHWSKQANWSPGAGFLLALIMILAVVLFAVVSWRCIELPASRQLRRILLPGTAQGTAAISKM